MSIWPLMLGLAMYLAIDWVRECRYSFSKSHKYSLSSSKVNKLDVVVNYLNYGATDLVDFGIH